MSLKGLRFTLEIDGQEPDTFAVVDIDSAISLLRLLCFC